MRTLSKFCKVLSVIGVIAIILGLVLSSYGGICVGDKNEGWKYLKTTFKSYSAPLGFFEKIGLRTEYFDQLQYAMFNFGSTEKISDHADIALVRHAEKYNQALETYYGANYEKNIESLNQLSVSDLNARFGTAEERLESKVLDGIFTYFESFTAAPKGKKIALTPAANVREDFENFYTALCDEYGIETVGSYAEFALASKLLIEQYAAENKLTSVMDYMNNVFTIESLQSALETVRNDDALIGNDILSDITESIEAGKTSDEYIDTLYGCVLAETGIDYDKNVFTEAIKRLLESKTFNGSYDSVASMCATVVAERDKLSWTNFKTEYNTKIIAYTREFSKAAMFMYIWAATTYRLYILAGGIVLVILCKLTSEIIIRKQVKKRENEKSAHEGADSAEASDILLEVKHLKQYFKSGGGITKAVDDVSFYIKKGEVLGLVGESGCGKTTTGRTIINLYDPTEGDVYFKGLRISSGKNGSRLLISREKQDTLEEIRALREKLKKDIKTNPDGEKQLSEEFKARRKQLKKKLDDRIHEIQINAFESDAEKSRCEQRYKEIHRREITERYERDVIGMSGEQLEERKQRFATELKLAEKENIRTRMQMIFQDPIASINPRMTVREIIAEGLTIRGINDKKYIDEKVYEMLELVGLVREHADRYPHEFSGGQRQRIGIARAIVMQPELIIADEPISALDVSIQAQVINLLNDLRKRMGLTILFIAHNLSVVKYFSDRIAVMYFGKLVELADSEELFKHPLHPYTKALLSAIPQPDPNYEKQRRRINYVPALSHDYSVDKPSMHEILPGHFIYCNEAELIKYREELKLEEA